MVEWLASGDAAAGPEAELLGPPGSPHSPLPARGALDMASDLANESAVAEAFGAMRFFENTHRLDLQAMGPAYMAQRGDLVAFLLHTTQALGVEARPPAECLAMPWTRWCLAMLRLLRGMTCAQPGAHEQLLVEISQPGWLQAFPCPATALSVCHGAHGATHHSRHPRAGWH